MDVKPPNVDDAYKGYASLRLFELATQIYLLHSR